MLSVAPAVGQTTIDDFENPIFGGIYPVDAWGQFGPLTAETGYEPFTCGDNNICLYHTFDTSIGGWGIVDLSPLVDLSGFSGVQFDARLVPEAEAAMPFVGLTQLDVGIEFQQNEIYERYDDAVTLTDEFQTFSVYFRDFVPRPGDVEYDAVYGDFSNVQLKFRFLGANGTGVARIEYDNILGLEPIPFDGDYNDDGVVDAADYTVWRDTFGALDESPISNNGDGANGVDQADYTLWKNAYGKTAPATAFATPEPAALSALTIALVCVGVQQRWRARA